LQGLSVYLSVFVARAGGDCQQLLFSRKGRTIKIMATTFRAVLRIDFRSTEPGRWGYATLAVELPFAPSLDIEIAHVTWHEAKRPKSVTYHIESGDFDVFFGTVAHSNEEQLKANQNMYEAHGWTVQIF
jgi:hypothetical protein